MTRHALPGKYDILCLSAFSSMETLDYKKWHLSVTQRFCSVHADGTQIPYGRSSRLGTRKTLWHYRL